MINKARISLFILAVMIGVMIALGLSGCAFYHRGETACGFLNDVQINHETKATTNITRPARD